MPKYLGISLGEGGRYVGEARKGGYIAVGWDRFRDTRWILELDSGEAKKRLTTLYRQAYPGSNISVGIGAGQVLRFVAEMHQGDVLLIRDSQRRRVHLARVLGDYEYKESWGDACPYPHRRPARRVARPPL